MRVPPILYIKSLLVGTPLEAAAKEIRWFLGAKQRHKHPELWEVYLEEQWLPLVLQKLLVKESRCVDVGCHIGSFLSLLKRYAPEGHHVAFEASVTKSRWLKRRFPDVEIVQCAVTSESGRVSFEENYARPGYSHVNRNQDPVPHASLYDVQACCLDDVLLDKGKVDFIKLDIEGGELEALKGGRKLISKWRPAILLECGSERSLNEENLSRKALYDFMTSDLDYQMFCFGDFLYGKAELTFDEFLKCGLYPFRAFNFVAIPR
jgi:FkbM family methyltransferase